jgi:PAS domain S-box-containing protein
MTKNAEIPAMAINLNETTKAYERPSPQAMVENLPVVMWTARPDGSIDFVNKFGLSYLGRKLEDLHNWSWVEVADPNELARIGETWSEALESGEVYETTMSLRRAKDGVLRSHRARAHAVRDESGRILYWIGAHIEL